MKTYKNPAELLDKILNTLCKNYNQPIHYEHLGKIVYDYQKADVDKNGEVTFEIPLKPEHDSVFINTLSYLNSEGLITTDKNYNISITASGFIKIKTKSFQSEIREKKVNNYLQRIAWIVTPLAALVTVGITVYKFFCGVV